MERSPFTSLHVENFTAFEKLDLDLAGGLNVFIGENATGKTHLLKVIYALVDSLAKSTGASQQISEVFANAGGIHELVRSRGSRKDAHIALMGPDADSQYWFPGAPGPGGRMGEGSLNAKKEILPATFVPVKEWLAHAPGFLSLYELREINFESVYRDILLRAYAPFLKEPLDSTRDVLARSIESEIGGPVEQEGERFYQVLGRARLDFALVAEGLRKLALLWLLLKNGSLRSGATLLWDEPDANLNPRLLKLVVHVLLTLSRAGVQIFIATHSYFVLKEIDLQAQRSDEIAFHVLTKGRSRMAPVQGRTFNSLVEVQPNIISDVFADLYDRDLQKTLQAGE